MLEHTLLFWIEKFQFWFVIRKTQKPQMVFQDTKQAESYTVHKQYMPYKI